MGGGGERREMAGRDGRDGAGEAWWQVAGRLQLLLLLLLQSSHPAGWPEPSPRPCGGGNECAHAVRTAWRPPSGGARQRSGVSGRCGLPPCRGVGTGGYPASVGGSSDGRRVHACAWVCLVLDEPAVEEMEAPTYSFQPLGRRGLSDRAGHCDSGGGGWRRLPWRRSRHSVGRGGRRPPRLARPAGATWTRLPRHGDRVAALAAGVGDRHGWPGWPTTQQGPRAVAR